MPGRLPCRTDHARMDAARGAARTRPQGSEKVGLATAPSEVQASRAMYRHCRSGPRAERRYRRGNSKWRIARRRDTPSGSAARRAARLRALSVRRGVRRAPCAEHTGVATADVPAESDVLERHLDAPGRDPGPRGGRALPRGIPLILDDLRAIRATAPLTIEGTALLPELVSSLLSAAVRRYRAGIRALDAARHRVCRCGGASGWGASSPATAGRGDARCRAGGDHRRELAGSRAVKQRPTGDSSGVTSGTVPPRVKTSLPLDWATTVAPVDCATM